jgi:hypothetical protein
MCQYRHRFETCIAASLAITGYVGGVTYRGMTALMRVVEEVVVQCTRMFGSRIASVTHGDGRSAWWDRSQQRARRCKQTPDVMLWGRKAEVGPKDHFRGTTSTLRPDRPSPSTKALINMMPCQIALDDQRLLVVLDIASIYAGLPRNSPHSTAFLASVKVAPRSTQPSFKQHAIVYSSVRPCRHKNTTTYSRHVR